MCFILLKFVSGLKSMYIVRKGIFLHGGTILYYLLFSKTNTLVFNFHTFFLQGYNRNLSAKTD